MDGLPLIPVQDPKHAKKTSRNQVFIGARLLTFAATTVRYDQVLAVQMVGSFLLSRDVINVDKQDDMAAVRTFSSSFLNEVVTKCSDDLSYRALAAYLFVLGDLCDSYLNRVVSHKERIYMSMRAWFFLHGWRTYVGNAYNSDKYKRLTKHFISDQSFGILTSLCQSLVLLVKVFREYYSEYPLLPWMYGSEACEHVFGDTRKVMPDFTLLDFFHIVPKVKYMQMTAYQKKSDPLYAPSQHQGTQLKSLKRKMWT